MKKVFLKLSQNSQENTCASASFLIFSPCEFYEIFKNTYFYRIPSVAASANCQPNYNEVAILRNFSIMMCEMSSIQ